MTLPHFPGAGQAVRPGLISPGYPRTPEAVTVPSPEAARVLTVIDRRADDFRHPAVRSVTGDLP